VVFENGKEEFALSANTSTVSKKFVLDSASTVHICQDRAAFATYQRLDSPRVIQGVGKTEAIGIGIVELLLSDGRPIKLTEVLHVPNLGINLFSIKRACAADFVFKFERDMACMYKSRELIAKATLSSGLWFLDASIKSNF